MNAQQEAIAKLEDRVKDLEFSRGTWKANYFNTMKDLEGQNQELKMHIEANRQCMEGLLERIEALENKPLLLYIDMFLGIGRECTSTASTTGRRE